MSQQPHRHTHTLIHTKTYSTHTYYMDFKTGKERQAKAWQVRACPRIRATRVCVPEKAYIWYLKWKWHEFLHWNLIFWLLISSLCPPLNNQIQGSIKSQRKDEEKLLPANSGWGFPFKFCLQLPKNILLGNLLLMKMKRRCFPPWSNLCLEKSPSFFLAQRDDPTRKWILLLNPS